MLRYDVTLYVCYAIMIRYDVCYVIMLYITIITSISDVSNCVDVSRISGVY